MQIFYVGHSMGTTTYMAMNSMDQSWADKVELAVFLAPVAYVGHMRSPVKVELIQSSVFITLQFQLLAPFADQVQFVVDHMGLSSLQLIVRFPIAIAGMGNLTIPAFVSYHRLCLRLGFSARPGEFLPTNWMNDLLTHAACGPTPLQPICKNAVFLFVGYDE